MKVFTVTAIICAIQIYSVLGLPVKINKYEAIVRADESENYPFLALIGVLTDVPDVPEKVPPGSEEGERQLQLNIKAKKIQNYVQGSLLSNGYILTSVEAIAGLKEDVLLVKFTDSIVDDNDQGVKVQEIIKIDGINIALLKLQEPNNPITQKPVKLPVKNGKLEAIVPNSLIITGFDITADNPRKLLLKSCKLETESETENKFEIAECESTPLIKTDLGSPMIANTQVTDEYLQYQVLSLDENKQPIGLPIDQSVIDFIGDTIDPAAKIEETPWHVYIEVGNTEGEIVAYLQGALIHTKWVLTSETTVDLRSDNVIVKYGNSKINKAQEVLVKNVEKFENLILLELETDVRSSEPIDFIGNNIILPDTTVKITTFEDTEFGTKLRSCEGKLEDVRNSECVKTGSPVVTLVSDKFKQIGLILLTETNDELHRTKKISNEFIHLTPDHIEWLNKKIDPKNTDAYKWHVRIEDTEKTQLTQGSLIGKNWILTSAKHLPSQDTSKLLITIVNQEYAAQEIFKISENGIALIKLQKNVPEVQPITVKFGNDKWADKNVAMITSRKSGTDYVLQECNQKLTPKNDCTDVVETCANSESTCNIQSTDVGSPLLFENKQIGVMLNILTQKRDGTNNFEIEFIQLTTDDIDWITRALSEKDDADIEKYSWTVYIEAQTKDNKANPVNFQGSLIDSNWVLTLSKAIKNYENIQTNDVNIFLGSQVVDGDTRKIAVEEVRINNEIALLKLAEPAQGTNIGVIHFTGSDKLLTNEQVTTTSFDESFDGSTRLKLCVQEITESDEESTSDNQCAKSAADIGSPAVTNGKQIGLLSFTEESSNKADSVEIEFIRLTTDDIEWLNNQLNPTVDADFKYHARIEIIADSKVAGQGSLIDKNWVLTSSKSLESQTATEIVIIINKEEYSAERIVYENTDHDKGIALIKLKTAVPEIVKPIVQHSDNTKTDMTMVTSRKSEGDYVLQACQQKLTIKNDCQGVAGTCAETESTCTIQATDIGSPLISDDKQVGVMLNKLSQIRHGTNQLEIDFIQLTTDNIDWITKVLSEKDDADIGDYSWTVYIEAQTNDNKADLVHFQGSLIGSEWVLTLSKAIEDYENLEANDVKIFLGSQVVDGDTRKIAVEEVRINNKIALLKLAEPAQGTNIGVIHFTGSDKLLTNEQVTTTSFDESIDGSIRLKLCVQEITESVGKSTADNQCAKSAADIGSPAVTNGKQIGLLSFTEESSNEADSVDIEFIRLTTDDIEWLNNQLNPTIDANFKYHARIEIIAGSKVAGQGSLIDKNWVLTSSKSLGSQTATDIVIIIDKEEYSAERIVYENTNHEKGIALIKLKTAVPETVKPIVLHSDNTKTDMTMVTSRKSERDYVLQACQQKLTIKNDCLGVAGTCAETESTCTIQTTDIGSPLISDDKQVGVMLNKLSQMRHGTNQLEIDFIQLTTDNIDWVIKALSEKDDADIEDYSWTVYIEAQTKANKADSVHFQGSLIGSEWVLTLSKAIEDYKNLETNDVNIFLGSQVVDGDTRKIAVEEVRINNKIALLKLAEPAQGDIIKNVHFTGSDKLLTNEQVTTTSFDKSIDGSVRLKLCVQEITESDEESTADNQCAKSAADIGSPAVTNDKQIGLLSFTEKSLNKADSFEIEFVRLTTDDIEWLNNQLNPTDQTDFRYHARIETKFGAKVLGQGSLIDKNWVLTSIKSLDSEIEANLLITINDVIYFAEKIVYKYTDHAKSIALIKLTKTVPVTVLPIEVHSDDTKTDITMVTSRVSGQEYVLQACEQKLTIKNNCQDVAETCAEAETTCTIQTTDIGSPLIFADKQVGLMLNTLSQIRHGTNQLDIDFIQLTIDDISWIEFVLNEKSDANIDEYPWTVYIEARLPDTFDVVHFQGSLIGTNWVLTLKKAIDRYVDLPDHDVYVKVGDVTTPKIRVKDIITYSNIALLELAKEVTIGANVQIVSFWGSDKNLAATDVTTTSFDDSTQLKYCKQKITETGTDTTANYQCAKSAADMGSPAVNTDHIQIGILSFKEASNNREIEFVRLTIDHIDWLNYQINVVENNNYKWHAHIFEKKSNTNNVLVGQGALVANQWILTTAQSLSQDKLQVKIGSNLYDVTESKINNGVTLLKLNENVSEPTLIELAADDQWTDKEIQVITVRTRDGVNFGLESCAQTVTAKTTCNEEHATCAAAESACNIVKADSGSPIIFNEKQVGLMLERTDLAKSGSTQIDISFIQLTNGVIEWIQDSVKESEPEPEPEITDYPWHVLIITEDENNNIESFFQGSLIDAKWILTSGEALAKVEDKDLKVIVGTSTVDEDAKRYNISGRLYKDNNNKNGLALLELDSAEKLPDDVKPIEYKPADQWKDKEITASTFSKNQDEYKLKICKQTVLQELGECAVNKSTVCTQVETTCDEPIESDVGSPLVYYEDKSEPGQSSKADNEPTPIQIGVLATASQTIPANRATIDIELIKITTEDVEWIEDAVEGPTPKPSTTSAPTTEKTTPQPTTTAEPDSSNSIRAISFTVCISLFIIVIVQKYIF